MKTVIIGKRLVPVEQIALVEPFDAAAANPRFQSDKEFKARVVLLNRDSILTEEPSAQFAETHGFRRLAEEDVGANPLVHFNVEKFYPAEGFNPTKPYLSRLVWRDLDGNTQSKLLLAAPEAALAIVVRGEAQADLAPDDGEAAIRLKRGPNRGYRKTLHRKPSPKIS